MTFYTVLYVHLEKTTNKHQLMRQRRAGCSQRILGEDKIQRMNPKQLNQTGSGLN